MGNGQDSPSNQPQDAISPATTPANSPPDSRSQTPPASGSSGAAGLDLPPSVVKKEKGRVRFNSTAGDEPPAAPNWSGPYSQRSGEPWSAAASAATSAATLVPGSSAPRPPRPSVLRGSSYNSVTDAITDDEAQDDPNSDQVKEALRAHARAQHVAARLLGANSGSVPGSRRTSMDSVDSDAETVNSGGELLPWSYKNHQNHPASDYGFPNTSTSTSGDAKEKGLSTSYPGTEPNPDVHHGNSAGGGRGRSQSSGNGAPLTRSLSQEARDRDIRAEAERLVRSHTQRRRPGETPFPQDSGLTSGLTSGQTTPLNEREDGDMYVKRPAQYHGGILSNILKLYNPVLPSEVDDHASQHTRTHSAGGRSEMSGFTTPTGSSGTTTPRRKWYDAQHKSQDTLANLVEASVRLGGVAASSAPTSPGGEKAPPKRPKPKRSPSKGLLNMARPNQRAEDEVRITIHIAEVISRQKYIIKLCRALMIYGAPTHRLEEYLRMTARVLEIQSQFLYLPGCMIISFDDRSTHTTEVKIVRTNQGIDLGKLQDVHEIYKEVLHDVYGVDEAYERLNAVMEQPEIHRRWKRILVFGLASACVAPFAFHGRLLDLPICFTLGCLVGFLQLVVSPSSELYNNVFEVTAAIVTSFLSRAIGSAANGQLFCMSAMAQSSIALILPGWLVLCSALELQSKAIVPGSIRMVYAIIYSLILGYGITLGNVLYGFMDRNAVSVLDCPADNFPMSETLRFVFVPFFAACLAYVNQAKWRQMPVMIGIAFTGYIVNFYSNKAMESSPQIANTLGAFCIGVLANLYSRFFHGLAVAALLPAIFVQVPSGLAATGNLLSGVNLANQITHSPHSATSANGTAAAVASSSPAGSGSHFDTMPLSVAMSMVQIAIGITVGLFLSALIIYPLGKRRSGLFTL